MAEVEIREVSPAELAMYATIPSQVCVAERVVREHLSQHGVQLRTVPVREPYTKRYDEHPESDPLRWPTLFTLTRWGLFVARRGDEVLGGAAIAPGGAMAVEQDYLPGSAVLWDIRVGEAHRGTGIGAALFRATERWCTAHGFTRLLAETQDVNAGACRFYEAMGCTLACWEPDAYADCPGEARLVWERAIVEPDSSRRHPLDDTSY
jgi:GNAT superfamily N-acetyltransferase